MNPTETGRPLTVRTLRTAAHRLAEADPQLGASVERYGPPPLWSREPSYATLVHLILEQQVSLASAQAAFDRLRAALGGSVEPGALLRLDDAELRAIGFSRQKAGYARTLASAMLDGFDLPALGAMPDDEVPARADRDAGHRTLDRRHIPHDVPAASGRVAARRPRARDLGP